MSDLKDFDTFWLEKGQEIVNNTFDNLHKHLKNYSVYLKALLGFYTVIGLTTEMITKTTDCRVYALFVLPYIILFLSMFRISVGQKIETKTLDIRSPLQINAAFNEFVTKLKKDIVAAKIWVSLATLAVLAGGSGSLYLLNKELKVKEKQDKIEKRADKIQGYQDENLKEFTKGRKLKVSQAKNENKISIEAKFTKDETLLIKMITIKDDTILTEVEVPKLCDFKTEVSNAKQLISIKIK